MYYKNKDFLNFLYHAQGFTMREIAKMCDCSRQTIWKWMRRLGVQTRTVEESQRLERTRIKMREAHKGKYHTEETRKKMRKAFKNRKAYLHKEASEMRKETEKIKEGHFECSGC